MSGLTFQELKRYHKRCNPDEFLEPDDERNVNLDAIGEGSHRPRGVIWAERLAKPIAFSDDEPTFQLFTGLPGSGKSTELRRLMQLLEDPEGANLLPVYVDAEEVLDLTGRLDVPDLIMNLVYAAERAVLEAEGRDPEDALKEGYHTRLWHWLTTTETNPTNFGITAGVPGVATFSLPFEMKAQPSFRQQVRTVISRNLKAFLKEATDTLEQLQRRVRLCQRSKFTGPPHDTTYQGLVLIFDSLEKLRGTSANWREVLESAEYIFQGNAPYLHLPVHTLYTIPPALCFKLHEGNEDMEFMPMIKLRERDGSCATEGIEAARQLIFKRIPEADLQRLLEGTTEHTLDDIIQWSGGYPRDLVRLLRSLLLEARPGEPLTDEDLRRVRSRVDDGYRMIITEDSFEWLARIAHERYLSFTNAESHADADYMLTRNAILRYCNEKSWFDIHPSVRRIPGVAEALERLENPSTS